MSPLMLSIEEIVAIAEFLHLGTKNLQRAVAHARKRLDKRTAQQRQEFELLTDRIRYDRLITKAINQYYSGQNLGTHGLYPYRLTTDAGSILTSVATRPEWVGREIALDSDTELCQVLKGAPAPRDLPRSQLAAELQKGAALGIQSARVPESVIAGYIATIETRQRVKDLPIYRLLDVEISSGSIRADFAIDTFFRYRFGVGLLREELEHALVSTNLNVEEVVSRADELLPLRNYFLSRDMNPCDYSSRICVGGVEVLLAMASSSSEHDFIIPIHERSVEVSETGRLLAVVPAAFHQHQVDANAEVRPSVTVFREFGEELLQIPELSNEAGRPLRHDWYFEDPCLQWFLSHEGAYRLMCTSFGVNLVTGTYDFGVLLAVLDTDFWKTFGRKLVPNWEAKNCWTISSKDANKIGGLLQDPRWADQCLPAFYEGIKALRRLAPRRVSATAASRDPETEHLC